MHITGIHTYVYVYCITRPAHGQSRHECGVRLHLDRILTIDYVCIVWRHLLVQGAPR